jgi:IS605 OrfB family transposase
MKLQKTIKCKVGELNKGKQELIDLALCNSVNAIKDFMDLSLKNKTTSNIELHRLGYKNTIKKYNLSACIVHQSRNKAIEIIRSWKSNKRRLNKNIPMPEPRALRIRFDNVVFDVIKTENHQYQFWASFLIAKRKRIYIPLIVNSKWQKEYLIDLLNKKYKKSSADLVKKRDDYFIHITIKKESNFQKSDDYTPIGIDVGINNIAVINMNGKPKFFNGKRAIAQKKHFNRIKSFYQSRNNLKMLEKIKGKEQRYFNHVNHEISSWIINKAKEQTNPIIVMEDLTHILEITKVRKKHFNRIKSFYQSRNNLKMLEKIKGKEQRYFNHVNHEISSWIINKAKEQTNPIIVMEDLMHILETTKVRKKQRYIHHTWAFKKLQNMIQYKALWNNISVVYVQPQYTSQVCPKCLSTNKRYKSNYKCEHCGWQGNADYVGAKNITKRFWEGISFSDVASINNAIGFSFEKPKAMTFREAKKSIQQGGCFSLI